MDDSSSNPPIENNDHFRLLFEQAPLGYQSLDKTGHVIAVNQAWLDLLGYDHAEVEGRWLGELMMPESREQFEPIYTRFIETGELNGTEFVLRHKSGQPINGVFYGRIDRDAQGNFKQTHCMLQDVSEQKQAEKEIEQHNRELSFFTAIVAAMNESPDLQTVLTAALEQIVVFYRQIRHCFCQL